MPTIRPLPRSLDPLPGESLPGFLLRLAHRLDLAPGRVAVLTGLGKAVPGRSNMLVPAGRLLHLDAPTAAAFAQATRLEAHEVAGLCLDSLRGRYPPLDVISRQADGVARQPAGTMGLARWVLTRSTRYCPQCLARTGRWIQQAHGGPWEKRWHLPVVFACTVHRRLLLHQCPQCRRPVGTRRGGGLLARLHDATLHPAQCRTPVGAGAHWRDQSACGARLDLPPAAPATVPDPAHRHDPTEDLMEGPPLARLLDLQHKLAELLEPGGPTELGSAGRRTTAAQYVLDLRLLVGLLQASWPRARPLAEPWMQADAIDRHLDQQRRRTADAQRASRKRPDLVVYDRPPADPAACAGLLALADQILSLDDPLAAQQLLDPLVARVAARNPWVLHLLRAQPHCSDGLRAVITPQLRRLRPTSSSLRPTPAYRFGAQHVPQYLPVDWHDRHFRGLTGLNPRLLRRLAAIKLVQLTQGGSQQAAARHLGLPPGIYPAAASSPVQRWASDKANSPGCTRPWRRSPPSWTPPPPATWSTTADAAPPSTPGPCPPTTGTSWPPTSAGGRTYARGSAPAGESASAWSRRCWSGHASRKASTSSPPWSSKTSSHQAAASLPTGCSKRSAGAAPAAPTTTTPPSPRH